MEDVIVWIKNARKHNQTWDMIRMERWADEGGLIEFLNYQHVNNFWPQMSVKDWYKIVDEQKAIEETALRIADEKGVTIIAADNENNEISIPQEEDSAWQSYKQHLLNKGFSENMVNTIELSTIRILKQLSRETQNREPRKGLVVGNVQSGKTANMAALMAMAADWGWNMFIVLSGTIESLRKQTQKRLVHDLNQPSSSYIWNMVDNPTAIATYGQRAEDFHFEDGSKQCYLAVCLKQKDRLTNLTTWLHYQSDTTKMPPSSMMKVLVIDDEADQASINAAKSPKDRTVINKLILNLIKGSFRAMNYIGYTATPYANVLNEAPGPDSLYPKDFVATLAVSDEYFGPQQIFGNETTEHDGLSIIRSISDNDILKIKEIHEGISLAIPNSLKDAVCWFICTIACRRYWGHSTPVSMLVHTSRKVKHHQEVADGISQWIQNTSYDNIIDMCQKIWDTETKCFNLGIFKDQYPEYAKSSNVKKINDYPSFADIKSEIKKLLEIGIKPIQYDTLQQPIFHDGIHLCIDNNTQGQRLIYPESDRRPATAFIVVGGQTLSRGLTIEGLTSTFFLRSSLTADTLMQMGRWFGYREGYELLPRIWMSDKAQQQFEFLSDMDQELRDEIKRMAETGVNFAEVGPKIMNSPKASLIQIVSRYKKRAAVAADFDFSGHMIETEVFDNDYGKLHANLIRTSQFVESLGVPSQELHINMHNVVWRDVNITQITNYLRGYQFSSRIRGFNDIEPFIKWIEKFTNDGVIGKWNVILAGNATSGREWKPVEGISVKMVTHAKKYKDRNDNVLNIGFLRSPNDFLSDIEETKQAVLNKSSNAFKDINDMRQKAGLSSTPQLLLYIVDKDSQPKRNSLRFPLNACEDIAAFCINIPGQRSGSTVKSIQINIPAPQYDVD